MTTFNVDIEKVKQRLFVFADCKDQQQNMALSLVVNPEIIKILLDQLHKSPKQNKIHLLEELCKIFKDNNSNSLILAKRDAEIEDHNISILDDLISFILTIDVEQSQITLLGDLFLPFIKFYPVNSKNIRKITTFLSKLFYEGDFSPTKMNLSIQMLRILFQSQITQRNHPNNYFFMYGENSGIRMLHNRALWMFSKGFTVNLSFCPHISRRRSSLMMIRVKDLQFQIGLSQELVLFVKVFGDSREIPLLSLRSDKWYYLRLQYLLKSRLFNKVFFLKASIDDRTFQQQSLSIPEISQNDLIDEIIFGQDFHGKLNTIFLSRQQDFNQDFNHQSSFWISNWSQLQSKFKANKKLFESLYLVYVPFIYTSCNNKHIVYDISSRNHGQLLENTAIFNQNHSTKDINYFGGIYNLLPLFQLLKYFDPKTYPQMLEDILELFLTLFKAKFKGIQEQSINCRLFSIIGAQLPEINQQFITKHSLKLLFSIKQELKQGVLKQQFFRDLIWKFNIKQIINIDVIKELTKLISMIYDLNTNFYLNVYGVEAIFHYIIQHYQPIDIKKCCINHYLHSNSFANKIVINTQSPSETQQPLDLQYFFQNYTKGRSQPFTNLIIDLINHIFQTNQNLGLQTIKTILMFTVSNHSLCFIKMTLSILQGSITNPHVSRKQLFNINILGFIYLALEKHYHHQIITQLVCILKTILSWEESTIYHQKILFSIINSLKRYPKQTEASFQSPRISEVYSPESGFKQRKTSNCLNDNQQIEHLSMIIKVKKTNYSNYKPLLDALLSIILDEAACTINDEAVQILDVYYQITTSNFKRIIVKHIFCQIYEADNSTKEVFRVQFFFTFKFLLKVLIETVLSTETKSFIQEIQKLILDSLIALIIPVLNDRPKIYWYLLKLQAIMIILQKQLKEIYNEQAMSFVINNELRVLFKKTLQRPQCILGRGLENIIFYLYGVIFCSQQKQQPIRLFNYFKILQKQLLLIDLKNIPQESSFYHQGQPLVFMDVQIINCLLNKLPIETFDIHSNYHNKISHLLDPKMSEQLRNLKRGFLQQIAQMKTKDSKNQSFFDFFQNLLQTTLIQQKQTAEEKSIKTLSNKNVCLIQTILLMANICVEYYLKHKKYEQFKTALQLSQKVLLAYIFSMVNSGESTKSVRIQQNQLLKKVILTWLHFQYNVMDNEEDIKFNERIQETVVQVFYIISMIVNLLAQKIGNLDKLSDCIHYGGIMSNMETYNLYLLQFLDLHVLTAKKKPLITLSSIKQFLNLDQDGRMHIVFSEMYKDVFKRSGYMLKLLQYEVVREILQIKMWYKNKMSDQILNCSLGLTRQNFNQELSKQRQDLLVKYDDLFKNSQIQFMKQTNQQYRTNMYSWGKIWKRLRKYHYPWSDWINQRQSRNDSSWENKEKKNPYFKNKFSKCQATDGSRPILQVKLQEPWHVKKRTIERQIQYMAKDYHYNFYKNQNGNKNEKPKNFIFKIFAKANIHEGDQFNVEWIINNQKRKGTIKILNQKLQFLFSSIYQKDSHVDFTHFRLGEFKPLVKTWDLVKITNAIRRRYITYYQCLLIELENNTSLIFNFTDRNLDDFLTLFSKKQKSKLDQKLFLKLNNIRFYTEKFDYDLSESDLIKAKTQQWNQRKIGNFQYLLSLNRLAGRSFYDPTQYPVMPWVVSNYQSEQIVLRPLQKTMGALGNQSRRVALYQKCKQSDPFNSIARPYQYGTHYSSPGVVFNFLIRMSPYTEAGRTLQGGKFDIADRIFFSIKWAWRSATTQMSDVRELIPQFFYLPQFLLNLQFYDFGLTQTKQRVHNVELPEWSHNDAYEFITIHREILQGEEVSAHINQWIDLIFGYKQKGKEAQQSLNLFYYLTYEDSVDLESIDDPINRTSAEAQIVHFGQTPHQLFEKPHPKREAYVKRKSLNFTTQYKIYNPKRTIKQSWQQISQYSKGHEPILAISYNKINHNIVVVKCNNILEYTYQDEEFNFASENFLNLKKTKNQIYITDLNYENNICIFGNKFIATGFNLNGELRVYSTQGKLIETQYGQPKNCIFVNSKQNLLMTGGKDGLFQVYQIIYQDQNQLSLLNISSEQCYYPITHISQGFGFYCVCSGNIVSIYNISRSAVFVDKKSKRVRCKFLRSFTAKRKITYAQIVSSPLFSIVFYDNTQLWSYSINGQLLISKILVLRLNPLLYADENHKNFILCLQDSKMLVLSTPWLNIIKVLQLPHKQFTCMTIYQKNVLIGTSSGELIMINKSFFS